MPLMGILKRDISVGFGAFIGALAGFALSHLYCLSAVAVTLGSLWVEGRRILAYADSLGISPVAYMLSLCSVS